MASAAKVMMLRARVLVASVWQPYQDQPPGRVAGWTGPVGVAAGGTEDEVDVDVLDDDEVGADVDEVDVEAGVDDVAEVVVELDTGNWPWKS